MSSETGSAAVEAPSPDAFLARGISDNRSSEVRRGLEELRLAVAARPGHALSRMSLAVALLRAGLFTEAEREFTHILGEERARELADGRATRVDPAAEMDPEALLGLATSVHLQGGRTREAERLYRAYAERVGPLSKDAARAYKRLSELARDSGADWIDADAELAKAAAADPAYETLRLMPQLVDPRDYPELEPYLRPIEQAGAGGDTTVQFDTLPELILWVAPTDSSRASAALVDGILQLEILVGSDGLPLAVDPVPVPANEELEPLRETVMSWRFTPATSGDEPVQASILFGDVSRDEWSYVREEPGGGAAREQEAVRESEKD